MSIKGGTRALGIAESYSNNRSTLAGVITRADRSVDGFAFSTCTVGGLDASDAIIDIYHQLDREDIAFVFIAGVALAWYNILDIDRLRSEIPLPIVLVTFEESEGLESAIDDAFSNDDRQSRRALLDALPPREPVTVGNDRIFIRSIGLEMDAAQSIITTYTPRGGRPEPLRVARLAARAADSWSTRTP